MAGAREKDAWWLAGWLAELTGCDETTAAVNAAPCQRHSRRQTAML